MLLLGTLGALVAFSSPTVAIPASKVSIVQKISNAPQGWTKHGAQVDKTTSMVKLRFHLTQPRISEFHDLAMKARWLFSTPFTPISPFPIDGNFCLPNRC